MFAKKWSSSKNLELLRSFFMELRFFFLIKIQPFLENFDSKMTLTPLLRNFYEALKSIFKQKNGWLALASEFAK